MAKDKIFKILITIVALAAATVLILGSGFILGYKVGRETPKNIIISGVTDIKNPESVKADFNAFWEAWSLINDNYLNNSEVSEKDKVRGAIRGLVKSLGDDYSEFFDPEDNKKFQEDIQGNFGGIGAEIGTKNNQLIIVAPLKNTPASQAGLKPSDKLLFINSSSTDGITVEEAVRQIRGPEGTVVTLTILRDGWEKPQDIKIIRGNIIVPTVESEMKGEISYIRLQNFNANANQLFYEAMLKALKDGAKGLVFDLRNNPGGYLNVAVDLSGWFLPKGTLVVSEIGVGDERQDFKAAGNGALAEFPVVVLINKGSASASEILAGTLRDNLKVKLVGEKSFGKGTVQELDSLRDGSSLKLTIAHWVLPSGKILDKEGLEPDIAVELTDDDIKNERDPQLEKALEVVKDEVSKKIANEK